MYWIKCARCHWASIKSHRRKVIVLPGISFFGLFGDKNELDKPFKKFFKDDDNVNAQSKSSGFDKTVDEDDTAKVARFYQDRWINQLCN